MIRKKAFTLVELLVVISIIALLLSILIPSLNRAREQAKGIVCLSNMRQMCIAADLYTQGNNGYFPIAWYTTDDGDRYEWDFIVKYMIGGTQVLPGLLWQGQTITKIQQCPSFKGAPNDQDIPYSGYNYNTSFIGHGQREKIQLPAKIAAVKRPGACALFGDGQWTAGANKFMRSPFTTSGDNFSDRTSGAQGFRHLGKTNVAWVDGHAGPQSEIFTSFQTTRYISQTLLIEHNKKTKAQKIGFLSNDNSAYDLQ